MITTLSRLAGSIALAACIQLGGMPLAGAGELIAQPTLSPGSKFSETDGASLYANVCQACHMPSAQGAAGAGHYPALAGNGNLEEPSYPIHVVVNGLRAMPPVGKMMSDEQVAAVVNYVRTHFGNTYENQVAAADVAAARP